MISIIRALERDLNCQVCLCTRKLHCNVNIAIDLVGWKHLVCHLCDDLGQMTCLLCNVLFAPFCTISDLCSPYALWFSPIILLYYPTNVLLHDRKSVSSNPVLRLLVVRKKTSVLELCGGREVHEFCMFSNTCTDA